MYNLVKEIRKKMLWVTIPPTVNKRCDVKKKIK